MLRWIVVLTLFASPALADYQRISDEQAFLQALKGRSLNIGIFNLAIDVLPDGRISGTAAGWAMSGTWTWQDDLFCREMDWSGMEIAYNCQLVEVNGEKMRFTSDGGAGRAADFRLR